MNFISESNRIYLNNEAGITTAEVLFPDTDMNTVTITHTFVDDSLRGQGIAGLLMQAAANQLRRDNKKAVPACSYAAAWFQKHPEYQDILK